MNSILLNRTAMLPVSPSNSTGGMEALNCSEPYSFRWTENKEPIAFFVFITVFIISNLVAFVLRQYKKSLINQTLSVIISLNSYTIEMLNLSASLFVSFLS